MKKLERDGHPLTYLDNEALGRLLDEMRVQGFVHGLLLNALFRSVEAAMPGVASAAFWTAEAVADAFTHSGTEDSEPFGPRVLENIQALRRQIIGDHLPAPAGVDIKIQEMLAAIKGREAGNPH